MASGRKQRASVPLRMPEDGVRAGRKVGASRDSEWASDWSYVEGLLVKTGQDTQRPLGPSKTSQT